MKPRESGGNVPKKAKPIAKRRTYVPPPKPKIKVPPREVAVGKPVKQQKYVKSGPSKNPDIRKAHPVSAPIDKFPAPRPEVTRPVTKKQRQAIEKGAALHFTTKEAEKRAGRVHRTGANDSVAAPSLKLLALSAKPLEYAGKKVEQGLKAAGAPKSVQVGGRLVTEFAFPTNFVKLGYGKGAKFLEDEAKAAEAAGKTKKAASLRKAASENRRGVSAGVRLHLPFTQKTFEAETSGKTTARMGSKLFGKPIRERSKTASKIGQELVHDFRPGHLTETQHTDIRRATRERRAAIANADRTVVKVSRAREKAIGDNGKQFENAMERAPHSVQQQQALVRAGRIRRGTARARAVAERKATPVTREYTGKAVWVGHAGDQPVTITGYAGRHAGQDFMHVEESSTAIPLRELRTRSQLRVTTARQRAAQAQTTYEANLANLTRHNPTELSPALRKVAEHTRKGFQTTLSEMEKRGISPGKFKASGPEDAQRFVPHVHQTKLNPEKDTEIAFKPKPRSGVAGPKQRKIRQPLNVSTELAPETFVHGKPVQSLAQYERSKAEDIANHDFWQKVSQTGRPFNASSTVNTGAGERVYRVENRKGLVALEEWTGKHDADLANAALKDKNHTYVVLNKNTVEKVKRDLRMPGTGEGDTAVGRGLDRFIGGWKTSVTVYNPSYHARNIVGDTINARLADTHTASFMQSGKAMNALHARETFRSSPESLMGAAPPEALSRTIKIRNYGETTLGDIIDHAERMGVIRTGQHGAEVRELLGGSAARAGRIRSISEYREDLPRMATFLAALSRGKTLEEAADWSLKHHFDYADLTQVERRLRRVFPFYTFWARNTRLQAEKFLTRPGKYARFGVFLNEMARLAGFQDYGDYASQNLNNAQQRGIPLPVRWNGKVRNVFVGFTQTDLNNFDTNPDQAFDNIAQRVTFLKLVAELHYNQSAFFRSQIEDPNKPKVPAPFWVKPLQGTPIGKFLGVGTYVDRRTGQRILGWRAKADYAFRSLSPQTNSAVQLATGTAGSRNMDAKQQLFGIFTGVKITNADPVTVKINNLYEKRNELDAKLGTLQQALGKGLDGRYKRTKQTESLRQQLKDLDHEIGKLRIQRGDPAMELPGGQRPPKRDNSLSGLLGKGAGGRSLDELLGHQKGRDLNTLLGGG